MKSKRIRIRTGEEKQRHKEYNDKYRAENKEKINAYHRQLYLEKKEQIQATHKVYYENNKEWLLQKCKEWSANNRHKKNAQITKYRATKIHATPQWANLTRIECYYSLSRMLNKNTGKKWEVDHIVPLRGKNVCGLHVDYNLRVIPMSENRIKCNKFEVI